MKDEIKAFGCLIIIIFFVLGIIFLFWILKLTIIAWIFKLIFGG